MVAIIYCNISSVIPGYTPIHSVLVMTKSVPLSSPTTLNPSPLLRISSNAGCFNRLPANRLRVWIFLLYKYSESSFRVKPASSFTEIKKPNQLGFEFLIGSGRINPGVPSKPLRKTLKLWRRASTISFNLFN